MHSLVVRPLGTTAAGKPSEELIMRVLSILVSLLVVGSSTACILGTGSNCSDIAVPGVAVIVKDAVTGARICDATVQLTDSAGHKQILTSSGSVASCEFDGAFDMPGTYSILIGATGYAADLQNNVIVTKDSCHVRTTIVNSNVHK